MKTRRFLVLLVMLQAISAASRCKESSWINGKLKLDCTVKNREDSLLMIPHYYADDGNAISIADFSNNNLLSLDGTTLSEKGYKDARVLKFQGCNITQVFKANFEGLSILSELFLSSNKLRSIEAGSFADLGRLENLDLSNNNLVTLDHRTLTVLTNLRSLDLSGNHFQTLVIPGLVKAEKQNQTFWKMTEISLSDNPWRCNCELGPLHRDLKARGLLSDRVKCGGSQSAPWTQMSPGNFTCPPSLRVVSPPQMVDIGDNLTLRCQFEGNPMPTALWATPAGEMIREGSGRRISTVEERTDGYLGVVSIRLNFSVLTETDVENVECSAANVVGSMSKIIKISPFKVQQDSNLGLIVGLSILGGFALMSLFIGLLVYLLWRKKFQKKTKDSSFEMMSSSSSSNPNMSVSTLLPKFPTLPPMRRDQLGPSFINPVPKPPRTGASSRSSLALGPNDSHVVLTEQDELNCNYMMAGPGPSHSPHLMFSNQSFATSSSISDHPAFVSWLDNRPGSRASIVTVSSLVSSPPAIPSLVHSHTHPPCSQARPGYVTLPRKPKQRPPVSTVDYLGPRTSGDGSSLTNINKITLTAMKFPPLPENIQQLEPTTGLEQEVGGADTSPLQRSLLDPIPEQE